jgi:prepilin-type N-terminal cleavage/methylation domain-containing protein
MYISNGCRLRMKREKQGLTLIEVVLAAAILSMCLAGMLVCLSRCMAVMRASKRYHEAVKVLGMGDVKHTPRLDKSIEEIEVAGDSDIVEGYTYSRLLEEEETPFDPEEDHIYMIRTRVTWEDSNYERYHEVVQYLYHIEKK